MFQTYPHRRWRHGHVSALARGAPGQEDRSRGDAGLIKPRCQVEGEVSRAFTFGVLRSPGLAGYRRAARRAVG